MYVSTTGTLVGSSRRRRRSHSDHFKAEAVGACQQPGISVAAVALARGVNASLLHRWLRQAERSGKPIAIRPTAPTAPMNDEGFVPVILPSNTEGMIRIKVRRRGGTVIIEWPAAAAHECALLLREIMR